MKILNNINSPADIKATDGKQLQALCTEIREFLVESVSKTGGHLASNLGAVELTVALHRVFDTEKDRIVFDVGHQCYVHKILTGRADGFDKLRQYGGIAGFPKPNESIHDAFVAGHASNSISVALGMAKARRLSGGNYSVIALIGDGALTGGLAYEGLVNAGDSGEDLIVVLNDNGMSIAPNVGGMASYLSRKRLQPTYRSLKKKYRKFVSKVPGGKWFYKVTHKLKSNLKRRILKNTMFEDLGFNYAGPIDGHDIERIEEALTWARDTGGPTLVHIITKKGQGYAPAEDDPGKFHGVSSFDPVTGETPAGKASFSDVFGKTLCTLAGTDEKICAITAAMTSGTGLEEFAEKFGDRLFDVGIAEGHAVSMASGIAACGGKPVFAVYSTFLQRSYDMLIHDTAIGGYHVVFCVDRAGLVGQDGETHHGVFDVGYLSTIPNMTILCPASFKELSDMLDKAVNELDGPVAVRYPRGGEGEYKDGGSESFKVLTCGTDVSIITYGININDALLAERKLKEKGISASVIKLGCIMPLDMDRISEEISKTGKAVIVEECCDGGCIGKNIIAELNRRSIKADVELCNLGNEFIPHGDTKILREKFGIDFAGIVCGCERVIKREQKEN